MSVDISRNFKDTLNKNWIVKRKNRTSKDSGGFAVTLTTVGTIKGRLSTTTRKAVERNIGGSLKSEFDFVFFTSIGEDIQRDDLLEGVEESITVRVVSVREPSHIDHHLEAGCIEIEESVIPTS